MRDPAAVEIEKAFYLGVIKSAKDRIERLEERVRSGHYQDAWQISENQKLIDEGKRILRESYGVSVV